MKKFIATLLSLMIILSLAACGNTANNDQSQSAGSSAAESSAETQSSQADAEKYGEAEKTASGEYLAETITVGVSDSITSFDPFIVAGSLETAVVNIKEFLGVCTTDGQLKLLMLKKIDKVDDLTYDCELWDFIYDTAGNNITSEDVQFCMDKRNNEGQKISGYDHIEITGDYTFKIICSQPFAAGEYEKMLSNPYIVSQKAYEDSGKDMASKPVGTGPYMLKEYMEGSYAIFEANEDYWYNNITDEKWLADNACPDVCQNFKYIRVDTITDSSARAIALENGSVDAAAPLNALDVEAMDKDKITPIHVPEKAPINLVFNCTDQSVMGDVNMRKAFCYAVDNEAIALGLDIPAYASYGIQPRMFDAPANWMDGTRDYYNFDADKVKEYLTAAGYNGETVRICFNSDSTREAVLILVQAQLNAMGINAELSAYEKATSPALDFGAWDVIVDRSGGGSYLANTLSKWYTPKTDKELNGVQEFGLEDHELDSLYEAMIEDVNDKTIEAWDNYFTFEKCYAYSTIVYDNMSGCSSKYTPACTMDRYRICPGAFTLAD